MGRIECVINFGTINKLCPHQEGEGVTQILTTVLISSGFGTVRWEVVKENPKILMTLFMDAPL